MSNSTVVEWLNENEMRSYPLVEAGPLLISTGSVTIDLRPLILDAAFFYEEMPDSVLLESITTSGSVLTINVTGQPVFTLNNYQNASYPAYIRNTNNSLLVVGTAAIPSNLSFNVATPFEPCVSTEIYPAMKGVTSVTLDNHVFTGDIAIADGYQLTFLPESNILNIEVGRNEGHPLPCISILGIENDCSTIASFVNGASPTASGQFINLIPGKHTKIFDDPDNHRIYIGYDFGSESLNAEASPYSISAIVNSQLI